MYRSDPTRTPFENWFKENSRYCCYRAFPNESRIYPGFIYRYVKGEKVSDFEIQECRINFYFSGEDTFNQRAFIYFDYSEKKEPDYSHYFVLINSAEEEAKLIAQYQRERDAVYECQRRLKWFKVGQKYLYYKELVGTGFFINQMKVGEIYTYEGSWLGSVLSFFYTPTGEPQSVQYPDEDPPRWESYFREIKEP